MAVSFWLINKHTRSYHNVSENVYALTKGRN